MNCYYLFIFSGGPGVGGGGVRKNEVHYGLYENSEKTQW